MKLELIAFATCPFAQRSRLALLICDLPHQVTFIEPGALPAWFAEVSPLGKVPLLRVDGGEAIFESAVIGELIADLAGRRLLPAEPVARARARAWIEFISHCVMGFVGLVRAPDEAAFTAARGELIASLGHLERQADAQGPWFLGAELSLVDIAFAPLAQRLQQLAQVAGPLLDPETLPRLLRWSQQLLALPELEASVDGDARGIFLTTVNRLGPQGYLKSLLG